VRADGVIDGFVGGTCAEASVREYGLRVLSSNEPLLLRIVPEAGAPAEEEGAVTVANPCLSGGSMEIFLEPRVPEPRVLVVGDTPIAVALASLGRPLGFAVELAAGESAVPGADDAALVVASHGRGEEPALTAALRLGVPYVGLIASRKRGAAVLAALEVPEEDKTRIRTPAGLDIGARTAPEIALSVLAEIVQVRRAGQQAHPVAGPATAVDPVCGMTVAAVEATLHAEVDGVVYWFCAPGCRRAFLKDPESYAPAAVS
jgi:xanthine dehydrogenase accessory factor